MLRLVAEISRMLTFTGRREPTGSTSPSWMARSSFTCMSSGSSATSSRNSVPPSASWNLPMCAGVAPVKAPFSWPNRIDSTRFSGIAPQLTATKGLPRAVALALDGAGDHFLADARFALDQDRDVGLRAAAAEAQHVGHGGRRGDEVGEGQRAAHLLVQPLHLLGERIDLEQVLHRDLEALGAHRLHHEIIGAGAHRLDDGLDRALRGLHDDRQVAADRLQAVEELEPVHAGHVEIEDDQFDGAAGLALQHLERLRAAIDRHRVAAEAADHFLENSTLSRIVFDDENADSHAPVNFFLDLFLPADKAARTARPGWAATRLFLVAQADREG